MDNHHGPRIAINFDGLNVKQGKGQCLILGRSVYKLDAKSASQELRRAYIAKRNP